MSFLVIDFTYLVCHDVEMVVKDLAAVDLNYTRVSSYVLKRPYTWEEVLWFNAKINAVFDRG
jgi:hypothetical protein